MRSPVGHFRTAPKLSDARTITFAYSGDADAQRAKGQSKPFSTTSRSTGGWRRSATTSTSTSATRSTRTARSRRRSRAASSTRPAGQDARGEVPSTGLACRTCAGFVARPVSTASGTTTSSSTTSRRPRWGEAITAPDVRPFTDYAPIGYTPAKTGSTGRFRWGKNVELFFLDERSFRSAKASANHVCDNPQSHQPDVAPTLPQSKRTLFSALVPSLSAPVSPKCIAKINDPTRTMLGRASSPGSRRRSRARRRPSRSSSTRCRSSSSTRCPTTAGRATRPSASSCSSSSRRT